MIPEVGHDVYVPSSKTIDGIGFMGGLCRVTRVAEVSGSIMVFVAERTGHPYSWDELEESRDGLRRKYGLRRGRTVVDVPVDNSFYTFISPWDQT